MRGTTRLWCDHGIRRSLEIGAVGAWDLILMGGSQELTRACPQMGKAAWKTLLLQVMDQDEAPCPMEAPPEQNGFEKKPKKSMFSVSFPKWRAMKRRDGGEKLQVPHESEMSQAEWLHILSGLMREEEESGPEIKQEFGKTNSSNLHASAAGEKFQCLLDLGKGPSSSPTNSTTPHGIRTSGSFLLGVFYERRRKTFLAALGE